jgi:hypothetical protein
MNTFRIGWMAFVVGALTWLPMPGSSARADDDWEDRWEDYYEELEDRREEARERAKKRWEKTREWEKKRWEKAREWEKDRWEEEQEWLEERYDDGVILHGPRPWQPPRRYYGRPGPSARYRMYYRRPVVEPYYSEGPPVYEYYSPYPRASRFYGTPGFGYVEHPYGRREVQAGPVRMYWNR